ncbi:hypothetical protein FHS83_000265 [Rhizomicrobium palustre]|uniref:DUF4403 family protein n=1 Tax=Rhizomicrobium palustre TaxID=189966 RepID=A0A846MVB0_9PROT|nr:DUF4403 family protein [Rhizomicrobium palustre]NIK86947.1 hypothetical protein [Rhizomicrobium palustre]
MNMLRVGAVSAALLVLAGCGGVSETSAPPPALTPPPAQPLPPVSSVSATLSIPLSDLQRLVNEKVPQRFADIQNQKLKCVIGSCTTSLSASRTGPITFTNRNGALAISVPFAVSANIALPGLLSVVNAGVNTAGQLNAVTAVSLGPDWSIRPNTSGSVQFQNGRLKTGPLDTDFATLWNANAELLSRPLLSQIEAQMAPALAQQKTVAQIWAGVFTPIKLNTKPTTWLVLQPERIRVGTPRVQNDTLTMGLGVDVRARLAVSDARPNLVPTPLPPPALVNGPANRFAVSVPAVLPYDEAAKLALDALKKNPPRVGSHLLQINALKIMPSGQDVVIEAGFCIAEKWDPTDTFSGCGSGYLRGVPQFDTASQTIRIVNVHYDVLTQNWMLSVMRGLAGGDLAKAMEKALQFNVSGQIKGVQDSVRASLSRPQGEGVMISGAVQSFGPVTLTWSRDGFVAMMSAEGSVKADVKKM